MADMRLYKNGKRIGTLKDPSWKLILLPLYVLAIPILILLGVGQIVFEATRRVVSKFYRILLYK
jgi:hypothetical protein